MNEKIFLTSFFIFILSIIFEFISANNNSINSENKLNLFD